MRLPTRESLVLLLAVLVSAHATTAVATCRAIAGAVHIGANPPAGAGSVTGSPAAAAVDRAAKSIAARINEILGKVCAADTNTRNVETLIEIDRELVDIVQRIQAAKSDRAVQKYWRREYEQLGLFIGHYSGTIGYSRKFLVEAHRRNPNSPYREYTLFSTIIGESTSDNLGVMPNIDQARSYLAEFPRGPYAADTYAIVGYFYDDLSKLLKRLMENERLSKDYKYDCFAPYLSKEPYRRQFREARDQAMRNLARAIAMDPAGADNEYRRDVLASIKDGTNEAWHWCAD